MTSNNNRIISFSGRKESGKTELANICVDFGYEKISFATELKKLVCKLVGFNSINELNEYKNKPIGKKLLPNSIDIINENTNINKEFIEQFTIKLNEKSTGRDWLQVVGTDIIREKDPDWHVRKTLGNLNANKNYVIDDTRFKNELEALKKMGAECWFIIRNKTDNISNHASETSLSFFDFDYNIIVNDIELNEFRKRWKCFFECSDITIPIRKWLISALFFNSHIPMTEDVINRLYIYKEFKTFKDLKNLYDIYKKPYPIVKENDKHNGFIGDDGNPFIMESLKIFFDNSEKTNKSDIYNV